MEEEDIKYPMYKKETMQTIGGEYVEVLVLIGEYTYKELVNEIELYDLEIKEREDKLKYLNKFLETIRNKEVFIKN